MIKGFKRKARPIRLKFDTLGLELAGSRKVVLEGVTGEFNHSSLIAIMGPSGAGKTTFLNVLCGKAFYGKMTGDLFINDKKGSISDYQREVGFVPQLDTVHTDLTVRENLAFAAALKLPSSVSKAERMQLVADTIDLLGLHRVTHTVVGDAEKRGISGGQLKRVNIGLELVADPTLLFLDEPTSGLDSTSSLEVLDALRRLSRLGMTVITVIHQPRYSIFSMFDQVLLLGVGGRTVYLGPATAALPYFGSIGFEMPANENPADFYMDIISGQVPRRGNPNFKPSELFKMWEQRSFEFPQALAVEDRAPETDGITPSAVALLCEKFDKFDTSHDGYLSFDELKEALNDMGLAVKDKEFGALCKRMDEDGKGRISLKSFLSVIGDVQYNSAIVVADNVSAQSLATEMLALPSIGTSQASATSKLFEDDEGPPSSRTSSGSSGTTTNAGLHKRASFVSEHAFAMPVASMDRSETNVDIPLRQPPSRIKQFMHFVRRCLVQAHRAAMPKATDMVLCLGGGLCVGGVYSGKIEDVAGGGVAMMMLMSACTIGLITVVAGLRPFGNERMMYWREASSGTSTLSYFVAKNLVFMADVIILPLAYTIAFRILSRPTMPFREMAVALVLGAWATSGIGMFISTLLHPNQALLLGVLSALILGGFLAGVNPKIADLGSLSFITWVSYNRPLTEYLVIQECAVQSDRGTAVAYSTAALLKALSFELPCAPAYLSLPTLCPEKAPYQICKVQDECSDTVSQKFLGILILHGFVLRILAYLALRFLNSDKKK